MLSNVNHSYRFLIDVQVDAYGAMFIKIIFIVTYLTHITLQQPVVHLPDGLISGRQDRTAAGTIYYAFEKIPYAAPPVGDLRFQAPQPPKKWIGTLNTTYLDIMCVQIGGRGNPKLTETEDCLYLNVFTKQLPNDANFEPLPVMVYIFGGGFMSGSSDYPPDLFVDNDVIFVIINYRLGPFGFLSTHDDIIPGNNGLKDQQFALKWIKKNIKLFGGDSSKITIFGQSTGGGSCGYHLLNQNSIGLFRGAILESGTFLSPGMFQRNPKPVAFATAAVINSTFEQNQDSQALLRFMKSLKSDEIKAAALQYIASVSQQWDGIVGEGTVPIWSPVIEVKHPGAFLTKKMYGLLEAGNVVRMPIMIGFTSEESILGDGNPNNTINLARLIDDRLEVAVPSDMHIFSSKERLKEGQLIRKIYTEGEPFANHLGALIRYSSDNRLTRAVIKHAELFSKIAPTYFYQFSYDGEIGQTGDIDVHYDGADTVGHTADLKYLFCEGTDCNDQKYPKEDLLTRQRLIKLWTNFAKYQNPTPEPIELLQNVIWPKVNIDCGDYFYLNINSTLEIENHPKKASYEGWIKLYNALNFSDFDTF